MSNKIIECIKYLYDDNKVPIVTALIGLFVVMIFVVVYDPTGAIAPSIDHSCCDSYCSKVLPSGECHRFTQEYIMCRVSENVTAQVPEFKGTTPVQDFWVYNISQVCPTNRTG